MRLQLANLTPLPPFVSAALLQYGAGRGGASRAVRAFCQAVWPVIHHVACLSSTTRLRLGGCLVVCVVVRLLPGDQPDRPSCAAFDTAMRRYYPTEASVEDALRARHGRAFSGDSVDLGGPLAPMIDEG